jgi:hypothetical protein
MGMSVTLATLLKAASLLIMIIVPGGLLALSAFVLAKLVSEKMHNDSGPHGLRFVRAVKTVKWSDVVRQTRNSL